MIKRSIQKEDRAEDLTQSEQQKEKGMKQSENSLRDLWDINKWTKIHITGVPEGKEREKGEENITKK